MPRVSILLTCYNHLRFLAAAYQGVLDQTFSDYEIVAVDDGSTDGTREWLSARPEPIRLIFNEANLGTYATLNAGLAAAKGEFIAVLNDDDLWAPQKLEKQLELLARHSGVGLVHTGGHFIDGQGERMDGSPLGFDFPSEESDDILLSLLYMNKIIASAALVRTECFAQLGGFNESYFGSGDWEMWLRIARQWEIGFVPEPLTYYRVHGTNASHRLERIWRDDERIRRWIATWIDAEAKRFSAAEFTAAKAHNAAALGTVLTLNGKAAEGRKAYLASMKLMPTRFKNYLRWAATFLPAPLFRSLQ